MAALVRLMGVVVSVLALTAVSASSGAAPVLHPGYGSLAWAPGPGVVFGAVTVGGIYVVTPGLAGARRLTTFGGGDSSLDWSPDGNRLLVSSGGVISVIADDGRAHRIARGYSAVWSPDGRRIAFDGPGGFYVARADGSGAVLVAKSRYLDQAPTVTWSPDGTEIAYVACRAPSGSWGCEHSSSFDVYISSVRGGARHRITRKTGFPQCVTWSRAGLLAWYSENNTTAVTSPTGPVRTFRPGGGCPVWSPDGRRFAVATATGLGFLNANGSGRRYLRPHLDASFTDPVWSPDGKSLALLVAPLQHNPLSLTELYTVSANATGFHRISLRLH